MACSISNKCAKNCCKRTVLVQCIVEDVVTCFFLKHNVVVFVVDKICDNTIVSEWNSLLICFVNCTDIYNFTNHVLTELKPEM